MAGRSSTRTELLPVALHGVGTYEWRIGDDSLTWSAGLVDLYGLDAAPRAEQGFTRLVHPDDRTRVEAETSAMLMNGASYIHEFRIVRPDGTIRHVHDRGIVERAADGSAVALRGINVDVTPQRTEAAADRSAAASAAAGVGLYEYDVAEGRSWWSAEMFSILDLEPAGHVRPHEVFWTRIHPDDAARVRNEVDRVVRSSGRFEIEFRVVRQDGTVRWVLDRGEARGPRDPVTGLAWRVAGALLDVTDRRKAEDAVHLTMQEVNHRSKNLLTLVQAVARQTARSNAADFVERFERRLQALANAQDLLVNGVWNRVALQDLARVQLVHFADLIGGRIALSGPAVDVRADAAQPLAMALHELATNAGKYGALSDDAGRVEVSWSVDPAPGGAPRFGLAWVERGGPVVEPPDTSGFGAIVLDPMMRSALDAEVEMAFAGEGFSWRLSCPAASVVSR